MKSILNVKKTSNLIKGISSHKICSEIKSQQVIKTICHSVPKIFIRILLFHFIKLLSTNQFHVCFQPINFMCAFSQLISCVLSPNQFQLCFKPMNFICAFNQSISCWLSTNQFHGCFHPINFMCAFNQSISWLLLIDKLNESCKNSKNFERFQMRLHIHHEKKALKKKRK